LIERKEHQLSNWRAAMPTSDTLDLAERLSAVPLFHGLPVSVLKRLARLARRKEATRRECFFVEGEDARDFFVLMSGRVKIAQQTSDGGQFVLSLVSPNEPFGGLSGSRGRRYAATAEAVQGSVAVVWPVLAIRQTFEHDPRFVLNTLDFVSHRLDDLHEKFRQFATERVERRVARILIRLADLAGHRVDGGIEINFPISRQEIAEMSGTTLFTVSRILVRWERQGILRIGRQRVVILRPALLE
jgi:CRP/FNR family transcriptional regulator, nitrogen oxide reductase regulator